MSFARKKGSGELGGTAIGKGGGPEEPISEEKERQRREGKRAGAGGRRGLFLGPTAPLQPFSKARARTLFTSTPFKLQFLQSLLSYFIFLFPSC